MLDEVDRGRTPRTLTTAVNERMVFTVVLTTSASELITLITIDVDNTSK